MLVEVTVKHLPNVGAKGTRLEMARHLANVLIRLGKVREVKLSVLPPVEARPAREYRRRDMVAEDNITPIKKKKRGRPRKNPQ